MRPSIRVIHNLPRSGGTIFARCLGCMDGVALLSEIHPHRSAAVDPATQARQYFNYLVPEGLNFLDTIEAIREQAEASGRILVVRDWSFPDFMPRDADHQPIMRSRLVEVLSERYGVVRLSLLRQPLDVLKSLRVFEGNATSSSGFRMSDSSFMQGCDAFEEMAKGTGFVRYEDLCRQPVAEMQRTCCMLQLPFDESFTRKWIAYKKVTGDVGSFDRQTIGAP